MAMNIKKGDTVVVLSGKDKGKQGKVLGTVPRLPEGCRGGHQHGDPLRQAPQAGRRGRHHEARGRHCRLQVQVVCPKCSKGTRVAHKIEGGKKTRVCKHCGAEL